MAAVYDLIILGAGCAGLSLAEQLAQGETPPPRTLILDQRTAFTNDRTWCFWHTADAVAGQIASYRWSQIGVQLDHSTCVRDCGRFSYVYLSATDFYQRAQAAIASQANLMRVQLDTKVVAVTKTSHQLWQVSTEHTHFFAKAIVDTRPLPAPQTADARMWQCFYGVEVSVNAPVFDASRATIMAIDHQFKDGLGFMYVLPTSPQHALLEYTVFSHHRYGAQQLKTYLDAQCAKLIGATPAVTVRDEYGALPMGQRRWQHSRNASYVYAGLFAGGARASTGYSFLRIQRWATACAAHLRQHGVPQAMLPDPWWLRWMDQLFLSVLLQHPSAAPEVFYRFFSQPSVAAIAHFMNDRPSIQQVLQIVAAMPKWLFLRTLLRLKWGSRA